jgi:hypothetical protein
VRLQFVLGSGLSSRLISWWGQGYGGYSHVDAVLSDGMLLGARSDAVGGVQPGVRIRPPEYEKWHRRCLVTIPATALEDDAWETWLRDHVGLGYDETDILGLILGRPMMTAGHWICSAIQRRVLRVVGKLPQKSPEIDQQCPPNMLLSECVAIGGLYQERTM